MGVVFGGRSVEHDVSIITGLQACEVLDARHQPVPIYIDREGRWFSGPSLRRIETYRAPVLDAEPVSLDLGSGELRPIAAPAAPASARRRGLLRGGGGSGETAAAPAAAEQRLDVIIPATHGARVLFVSGDPAMAYGERNAPGADMLAACRLDMKTDGVFYLAGDFHHYERRVINDKSLHVIAGGGGAFLHGTRISPYPEGAPAAVYPDAKTTRQLVAQVPLKLMLGRAGLLVHVAFFLLGSLVVGAAERSGTALTIASVLMSALLTLGLFGVAGAQGSRPKRILAVSIPFGVGLGFLPMALRMAIPRVVPHFAGDTVVLLAYAFAAAFIFGLFLVAVTVLGLEHQQAFTVLGHPGFKHFVRLCVHPEGKIEAWVIGKDDMLAEGPAEMIDAFTWE